MDYIYDKLKVPYAFAWEIYGIEKKFTKEILELNKAKNKSENLKKKKKFKSIKNLNLNTNTNTYTYNKLNPSVIFSANGNKVQISKFILMNFI